MRVSTGRHRRLICIGLALACVAPADAREPASAPGDGIRITLARWYEELGKKADGRPWALVAPGFIDATPHSRYVDTGARKLGPPLYTSLAAQALKFAWEIDSVRSDLRFARVEVRERGYFYAWAAQRTYERAATATFVLERAESDGRWLILAHRSSSHAIAPNKITDPMPDLRSLFYATEGKDRDPAADARAAAQN